jgi:hypothetical protein
MKLLKLIELIKEEIQDFYSDWQTEPSIADKYYERRLGITADVPTPEIRAELVGYVDKQFDKPINKPIPVYKNPKSLEGFTSDTRGILLRTGDLYLAQSYNALHDNILDLLSEKNIVPYGAKYGYAENFPKEFVAVVRAGNTKTFGQSSAYDYFPNHYIEIFDTGEEKQPYGFTHYAY